MEIDRVMRKHQLKFADRQCRMSEISQRLQDLVVMLATSCWAAQQPDELVRTAADVLCQDLRRKLQGGRPSDSYFRTITQLGKAIDEKGFAAITGIQPEAILMPYDNEPTGKPASSRAVVAPVLAS
jgi:hypothetical protein